MRNRAKSTSWDQGNADLPILGGMRQLEAKIFYEKNVISAGQRLPVPFCRRSEKVLRHHEDFLRIWILNFAPGGVTADIDQATVSIERVVDKARFARYRLGHGKLRLI